MSRVAYGQKGYSGASMSVNARAAYEAGEMPRSKWTKAAILGALRGYCDEMDLLYDPAVESETKAALFDRFIAYSSWHHTGAYARETEFFALDEAAVVGAFRELGPEEAAERDRIRAQAAARVQEAERHRREAECLFEYRFSCSPYSAMAYEAFHPELCERRVSKRRKQELVVYRLPDGSEPSGYAEMSVPADYADSSMSCRRFSNPARAGIARGAISTSTRPSGNSPRRREGPRPFARGDRSSCRTRPGALRYVRLGTASAPPPF